MHVLKRISVFIATLGPIGYMMAPGTIASLVTLPLVYWLQQLFHNQFYYALFLVPLFFVGRYIVHYASDQFGRNRDPSEIVFDELVGCLVTFWAIPFKGPVIIVGFALFRFLDISKIGGISYFERFNNGWGIMLDDVAAGLIANIIIRLIF